MATFSWRCLSFPTSFLISLNHSAFGYALSRRSKYHPKIFYFLQHLVPHLVLPCLDWILRTSSSSSTLSKLFNSLLVSSYFSTFCKHTLLLLLNQSSQLYIAVFSLYMFHLIHSICFFFFNLSSSLTSFSREFTSILSLFISPSTLRLQFCLFFFLCSAFFNPIWSITQTLAALIKLFVSVMFLLFKYLIASFTLYVWIFKTFLSTFLDIMPSLVLPSTTIFFNCSTIAWC